jgi:hypothetical protein
MRLCLAAAAAIVAASGLRPAAAAFNVSNIFGSHMVLQRDEEFGVWGWGCAGPVTTLFGGAKYTTSPDATGLWLQALPAQPGGFTPVTISFACGPTGETVRVCVSVHVCARVWGAGVGVCTCPPPQVSC